MSNHSPPLRPGFGLAGDRTSFVSTDTVFEDWDDDEVPQSPRPATKAPEQMSPLAVVLYVVFFYIVWQILTRSDDHEILSHLPSSSPLLGHHSSLEQRPSANSQPSAPYHLPYALPQLPHPPAGSSEPTPTWRTILNAIVYPIYLAVTLLAIPLPFLVNALNLLTSILSTILYPVTSTARLLARTFILAPLNVVLSFLHALYPVYVFVGGVVGVGAFLGVAIGWVGRMLMWLLLGRRSSTSSTKKTKKRRSNKRHSAAYDVRDYADLAREHQHSVVAREHHQHQHHRESHRESHRDTHREHHREREPTLARPTEHHVPHVPHVPRSPTYEYERRYVPIVDYVQLGEDMVAIDGRGTGRDTVVLGLRRRGVRV